MTIYTAHIPVREGHVLTVDGEAYHVLGRVDGPDHGDTFVVEHDGRQDERHIDWFMDLTADADRVVIEREGSSSSHRIEEHTPSTEWLEQVSLDSPTVVVRENGDRDFRVTVEEVTIDAE